VSFISKDIIPQAVNYENLEDRRFRGLHGQNILTIGKVKLILVFKEKYYRMEAFVIPSLILPTPLLLGRDVLKLLSLKLVIRKTVPNYENNYSLNNVIAVDSDL